MSAQIRYTTVVNMQNVKTLLVALSVLANMDMQELALTVKVCTVSLKMSLSFTNSGSYYTSLVLQILMSVHTIHTTAIHKQDVSTQLVDLGVNAEMDTLEMVFSALVGFHITNHNPNV